MRALLAALCLTFSLSLAAADFPDISHAELVAAIDSKSVVVLDVNGSTSFAETHIDGAHDFAAIKDDLASKLPEDKSTLIVAYCGSPACGAWKRAAKAVSDLGYTNVKHYSGGLAGWKEHAKAEGAEIKADDGAM